MRVMPFLERLMRRSLNRAGHESRWHESSSGRLHFFDFRGDGPLPPIVLLHGIGSSALPYRLLMPGLAARARRIVAPDAPGHGLSVDPPGGLDPDTLFAGLRELLDHELEEPAVVFGNSLGGALALRYGLERPEKVRGLMLVSPAGAQMGREEMARLVDSFRLATRAEGRRFFERLHHRPPWFSRLVGGEVRRQFNRPSVQQFLDTVGPEDMFTPEQVRALRAPTLLLWGASEQILPLDNLAWYKRHLPPSARIEQPDGFGHCPYLDRPRDVVERILQFVEQLG